MTTTHPAHSEHRVCSWQSTLALILATLTLLTAFSVPAGAGEGTDPGPTNDDSMDWPVDDEAGPDVVPPDIELHEYDFTDPTQGHIAGEPTEQGFLAQLPPACVDALTSGHRAVHVVPPVNGVEYWHPDHPGGTVDLLGARPVILPGFRAATVIIGSNGNDEIHGSDGSDLICTAGGDDIVHSHGGWDIVHAGDGADEIHSGAGDDMVHGNDGDDEIHAEAGDDQVCAGPGDDVVTGGWGRDSLFGGPGSNTIDGGPGLNNIYLTASCLLRS